MGKKTLYLIDAMALIYRSFYALNKNPRINSKGMNTSATLGFFNAIYDIIKKHQPSYFAVCFDVSSNTFRKQEFADYKANREAMPEDIELNLPYIAALLQAMNIKTVGVEGYEADDIIGTLAKKAHKKGLEVYMVTPDKDYAQLVEDGIYILKLPRMGMGEQVLGVKEVLEKFEISRCEQVIDILGLWGDSSDNIPGVKGIGEKKAKALLKQFDSIEDILSRLEEIETPSVRKAIEENREAALQSKHLATICTDAPVDFDEKEFLIGKPDLVECKRLFDELEFRRFADKFFEIYNQGGKKEKKAEPLELFEKETNDEKGATATEEQDLFSCGNAFDNIDKREHKYIETDDLTPVIAQIREKKRFSLAVEFAENNTKQKIASVAFGIEDGLCYWYKIGHKEAVTEALAEVMRDESVCKICYDIKKIGKALRLYDVEMEGKNFDIMLAHYLLSSEERSKIEDLSEIYLDYELRTRRGESGKEGENLCEQADVVLRLYGIFSKRLEEDEMKSLFEDVEMPLAGVLSDMEQEGIRIDKKVLKDYSKILQQEKEDLQEKIYGLAGEVFNIGSPVQLGKILFEKLDITNGGKTKKTKTKKFSTSEEVLEKLIFCHPIVSLILQWRSVSKLKSTYVDALPELADKETDRIHSTFNQAVTATGRLSSTNPNLQNIPIRTEQGKEIRRAFVPNHEGHYLLSADYSQIELRIIASLSGDEHLCNDFRQGKDIHLSTAAKIYHVSEDEVSKQMRSSAKSVNFGIIYGISAFGLSESLHVSRREAQELIDRYFLAYPRVKEFIEERIEFARKTGYAQTILHRRRYLPNINSANANLRNFDNRNAVNMTIQGTSADMIKKAMINIHREIEQRGLQSRMLLQIHDELIFDVPQEELAIMQELVPKTMEEALPLNIPIIADCGYGKNWLEIK